MWLLRILRAAAILTPIIPASIGYLLCRIVGFTYLLANAETRRHIIDNLRHVQPRASWVRQRITAARVCITVVTNYYDLIRLRSVDRDSLFDRARIEGVKHIECANRQGNGVIIFSAHVGNFNVMAKLPAALGFRSAIIAEEIDPPQLFNYMARLRSAMGIEVIPPGPNAVRRIIRLLRDNGVLLVAGDRDTGSAGLTTRYFGEETMLPFGPVILAMRTKAVLIPAFTIRETNRLSRVVIGEPFHLTDTGDWDEDVRTNMQRLTHELERMISTDPGQWAVLQRVWPPQTQYGHSEGLGGIDKYLKSLVKPQSQ